ncbi:hypothetical protein LTR36_005073 [Oleoguttula mirabilis]|uniref:Uncharacterized protein n=1 Tax=Oleoguttula mirabilis TaxID=1507867 RepID=A0AAV9JW71_9PEZI|nr:hypothetical protein LTR36_005073 [Oleoguttula mirabilis]
MPTVTARRQPRAAASRPRSAKRSASPSSDLPFCKKCDSLRCRNLPAHGKALKEQRDRKLARDVHQDAEMIVKLLFGWCAEKSQSKSNGTSAGLCGDKLHNQRAAVAVLLRLGEKEYIRAVQEGGLEELQQEISYIADAASEHGPLRSGKLINLGGDRCDNFEKLSPCTVHGHDDWRQCRAERMAANFAANLQRLENDGHHVQARL